jgi:hypothetical protein
MRTRQRVRAPANRAESREHSSQKEFIFLHGVASRCVLVLLVVGRVVSSSDSTVEGEFEQIAPMVISGL